MAILDIYQERKTVHVNLKKDLYILIRQKLTQNGISFQEFINHVVEAIVYETEMPAYKLFNRAVHEKRKKDMENSKFKDKKIKNTQFSELDISALYDLINDKDGK